MIGLELSSLLSYFSALFAFGAVSFLCLLERDVRTLGRSIGPLITGAPPQNPDFLHPRLRSAWRLLLLEWRSRSNAARTPDVPSEAASILASATSPQEVTTRLAALVHSALGGTAVSVVAAMVDDESGDLDGVGCAGQELGRALPLILSRLRLTTRAEGGCMYHPMRATPEDLSAFDIGDWYVAASPSAGIFRAALWVGVRRSALPLGESTRRHLESISRYSVAAAVAARRSTVATDRDQRSHGAFISLSHDLRAPGTTALYAIRDILSGACGTVNEEQEALLATVEECIDEQLRLLADLLDAAKIDEGYLHPRTDRIEIVEELRELLNRTRLDAAKRGLELRYRLPTRLFAEADPSHVRRVLGNLLTNAVKYSDRGVIGVIAAERSGQIEIAVEDEGIGIPRDCQTKLFERFARMENGSTRPGTGLGLHIARSLARANGGDVTYEPNHPVGSRFIFTLPAAIFAEHVTTVCSDRLLVVDDDAMTVRQHARLLAGTAREIRTAGSLDEALSAVSFWEPDVVVTDLRIAESTALPIALAARARGARVILVTGAVSDPALAELRSDPEILVLEKPTSRALLLSAVRGRRGC